MYLSTFLSRRGKNGAKWKIKITCHVPCLSNSVVYDHGFWYTCVKWRYLQAFVYFFKTLIFQVVIGVRGRGLKGQKRSKMAKNSICLAAYLRNHTSLWLSFTVHMFFLKFWLSGLLVSYKGKKWSKRTNNSVHCTPYLRRHTSCDCYLWYTFVIRYISRSFSFLINFDFSGC